MLYIELLYFAAAAGMPRSRWPCTADVQLNFVAELAHCLGSIADYPLVVEWLTRLTARDALARSIAKGGEYAFAFGG